jgi:hypothetical protein
MLKFVKWDDGEAITCDRLRLRDDIIGLDECYFNGWTDFYKIRYGLCAICN